MNERIRAREIRVIDDNGAQLGIMTPRDALAIARERGIDLIEVAPQANPPVCKIMDYGKFKYEQAKKEKESAKKSHQSDLKDIRLDPPSGIIGEHDLQVKVNNAIRFLQEGDKVKVTLRFRGRTITHPEIGRQQLERFVQMVGENGQMERTAQQEGRMITLILAPVKAAAPAKKDGAAAPKAPPRPSNGASGQGAPPPPPA